MKQGNEKQVEAIKSGLVVSVAYEEEDTCVIKSGLVVSVAYEEEDTCVIKSGLVVLLQAVPCMHFGT